MIVADHWKRTLPPATTARSHSLHPTPGKRSATSSRALRARNVKPLGRRRALATSYKRWTPNLPVLCLLQKKFRRPDRMASALWATTRSDGCVRILRFRQEVRGIEIDDTALTSWTSLVRIEYSNTAMSALEPSFPIQTQLSVMTA